MNSEQVFSIIRQMCLFGGGFLVAKGWTDAATMTAAVGGLIAFLSGAWAIYTRRNTGLIASAAEVPSVQKIETTSPTAQALPSPKVVAP